MISLDGVVYCYDASSSKQVFTDYLYIAICYMLLTMYRRLMGWCYKSHLYGVYTLYNQITFKSEWSDGFSVGYTMLLLSYVDTMINCTLLKYFGAIFLRYWSEILGLCASGSSAPVIGMCILREEHTYTLDRAHS